MEEDQDANPHDGWGWEFGRSCIIPGSPTSFNQDCITGQELPAPEARPGIMIDGDPDGTCLWSTCVPLCRVITTPSNPE